MRSAFVTSAPLPRSAFRSSIRHRPHTSRRHPKMSDDSLFAVRCIDKPDSQPLRAANRPAHLQWANAPSTNLIFAGPLRNNPDDPVHGSLLIMQAPTAEAVAESLLEDPYNKAGLFQDVATRKWIMGMASDELPDHLFVVWCVDKDQSLQVRKETRPRHLDWWKASGRRGIIGPFPCEGGANGTLIVCDGQSLEDVAQWAATDPYNQVNLFDTVHVNAVQNVVDRISKSKVSSE